jgi:selenocysteine-specific elongation factor
MIVATAGHVDHGKTTLIKALTGIDTTHLPEERRRGMTIDLGFAGMALPSGGYIGFIDVPGHERFMRNMLAGITGIDLALLIVAADEGIKPQTREHLEILDLLDIKDGAIALTKMDRVDDSRLAEVTASMAPLLARTSLAKAPVFAVSAPNAQGVPALRNYLLSQATQIGTRRQALRGNHFRLPIDRRFLVEGAGLVVTGTIASGSINVGDRVCLMPKGIMVRVRGLQSHHQTVAGLGAGERCAINVVGGELDHSGVGRGDWLVAPDIAVVTRHVDVRLRSASELQDGVRVQCCHGTACIPGRLLLMPHDGGPRYAQVVLDEDIHALVQDAFILRDKDGGRTLAGGVVVDPFPPLRGRRQPARLAMLNALDAADAAAALRGILPLAPNGVALDPFAQAWNIRPEHAEVIWTGAGLIRFEGRGYEAELWRRGRDALMAEVSRFHTAHPDSFGPSTTQLLRIDSMSGRRELQRALLDSLIHDKQLIREGPQIRRPSHAIEFSPTEKTLWRKISPLLGPNRRPMSIHDIASQLELELRVINRVLERAVRAGYLVRITAGRFLHKAAFIELAGKAETLAAGSAGKLFDAAAFRDKSNLGRGVSIELLEHFDRIGFTQRVGDRRRLLKPAAAALEGDRFESSKTTR